MTKILYSLAFATFFAATLSVVPPASAVQSASLTGAGSTFVYPVMARWAADFKQSHPGVEINYQSIGSGAGIQQVKNQTVDFGASDVALNDEQLKTMPAPVVQIPESAGPVCITYNLPLSKPLQLTAETLSGIFLGTITKWNDSRIVAANPGVSLPESAILVAHRSDGSGTTGIFTAYLSSVNPVWKAKVGSGTSVSWPIGLGGKGSEGVTGLVKQTAGAIGYVELTYANENHLPVAAIRNRDGKYVAPSAAGTSAAIDASAAVLARDVRIAIVDAPGPKSYPISGLTFLIIPKNGNNQAKRAALKEFVQYILTRGQASAGALNYAPLPASIQKLDQGLLGQLDH
ncbi:MAG TPA: phosphate ABC transporter substrate-binding protein PstS [Terriglobales bacterium]|nr:phosphate ABC transporter substrate-binding protein PstS [Terriglobales bacterium]